jgi:hypothetical protein
MPSIVSGDSFLRGFQASPFNFSLSAAFWACHDGRSFLIGSSSSSAMISMLSFVDCGAALSALCGGRAVEINRDGCVFLNAVRRGANAGSMLANERMNRPRVLRAQLWQDIVVAMKWIGE